MIKRGAGCSKEGTKYEHIIYEIVKHCSFQNSSTSFNTQEACELGGCHSRNDIVCNYAKEKDVPIEIKKKNTPDWMQCSLQYDSVLQRWIGSPKNKIPDKAKQIIEELLLNVTLFNGKIPPFLLRNMTHPEWIQLKKETTDFHDTYIPCPNTMIKRLYQEKGCCYIQISEKGLYHLGNDICHFQVPEFICEQQWRVRTKIHTTKNSKGFCKLSVTIACQPKNISELPTSPYSLDKVERLPTQLIFDSVDEKEK